MKFEEAIKDVDVIRIAKSAMRRYYSSIPIQERKSIVDFAIWRACECHNPEKSAFQTYVYNRVRFACKDYIKYLCEENKKKDLLVQAFHGQNLSDHYFNSYIDYSDVLECITNDADRNLVDKLYLQNRPVTEVAAEIGKSTGYVIRKVYSIINKLKMSINS